MLAMNGMDGPSFPSPLSRDDMIVSRGDKHPLLIKQVRKEGKVY